MNILITTAEQLAEAIKNDPLRIANALYRINRFGGQMPGCNVLVHSLAVQEELLMNAPPVREGFDMNGPAVRLWALLHDCHEVITGDVTRVGRTIVLSRIKDQIDIELCRKLGVNLPLGSVHAADELVGQRELDTWGRCYAEYSDEDRSEAARYRWAGEVTMLLAVVGNEQQLTRGAAADTIG